MIKSDILSSQERIEQTIKTQEEIIMDMINRFNDELLKHKSTMKKDMEKREIMKMLFLSNLRLPEWYTQKLKQLELKWSKL